VNSTDQGIVWSGATSFNASASWFDCFSFNVRMLFSSLRGAWAEERLLRAQGILLLIRGSKKHNRRGGKRGGRRAREAEAKKQQGSGEGAAVTSHEDASR
jgi:hypothetical protein